MADLILLAVDNARARLLVGCTYDETTLAVQTFWSQGDRSSDLAAHFFVAADGSFARQTADRTTRQSTNLRNKTLTLARDEEGGLILPGVSWGVKE
jgi:hypothetical protein